MLTICRDLAALRATTTKWRAKNLKVGLVPTMGALHAGHLSLIEGLRPHVDHIIVSIFVNPTQFAAHEDLDHYPRTEAADCEKVETFGADLAFIPTIGDMYPNGFATNLDVQGAACGLEADQRPHFFHGVATIVTKLFMQTQADVAIFGEKDYQQLLVIRQLVRDLNIPITILSGAIIRESDGLAMSSRNVYLSPEQRQIAGRLNLILSDLANSLAPAHQAETEARQALLDAGFSRVDYATIRDADTLATPSPTTTARRALIAARLGDVRLLDNMRAN